MARWATYAETAAYTGLTERQLRRARERGTVRSHNPTGKTVLFDLDWIDQWIEGSADARVDARTAEELVAAVKRQARNRRRNAAGAPRVVPAASPGLEPVVGNGRGNSSGEGEAVPTRVGSPTVEPSPVHQRRSA